MLVAGAWIRVDVLADLQDCAERNAPTFASSTARVRSGSGAVGVTSGEFSTQRSSVEVAQCLRGVIEDLGETWICRAVAYEEPRVLGAPNQLEHDR